MTSASNRSASRRMPGTGAASTVLTSTSGQRRDRARRAPAAMRSALVSSAASRIDSWYSARTCRAVIPPDPCPSRPRKPNRCRKRRLGLRRSVGRDQHTKLPISSHVSPRWMARRVRSRTARRARARERSTRPARATRRASADDTRSAAESLLRWCDNGQSPVAMCPGSPALCRIAPGSWLRRRQPPAAV